MAPLLKKKTEGEDHEKKFFPWKERKAPSQEQQPVPPEGERATEGEEEKRDGERIQEGTTAPPSAPKTRVVSPKSPLLESIEHVLEEDMTDIYTEMDPAHQMEFKRRGEETATMIERLIVSAKITVQKVFHLIISWLRIIPHVNRYYLEQEAKIKADKIMHIYEERRRNAGRT